MIRTVCCVAATILTLAVSSLCLSSGLATLTADVEEQGKVVWITLRGSVHNYALEMHEAPLLDSEYYVTLTQLNDDGSVSMEGLIRLKSWMRVPGADTSFVCRYRIGPVSHDETKRIMAGLSWCAVGVPHCQTYNTLATCEFAYTIKATSKTPFVFFCHQDFNPLPDSAWLHPLDPVYIKVLSDFHPIREYARIGLVGSYASQDTVFLMANEFNDHEARLVIPSVKSLGKYGILNLASWGKLYVITSSPGRYEAMDSVAIEPMWMK